MALQHMRLKTIIVSLHQASCPVHRLAPFFQCKHEGEPLFPGITALDALWTLRRILSAMKVRDASRYRTHDLRRGHALDLQLSGNISQARGNVVNNVQKFSAGAPLYEILAAGEWSSPAFLQYLDVKRLEVGKPH